MWSAYTVCTKNCGGGAQSRTRLCNNPQPSNGGLFCALSDGSGNRGGTDFNQRACNSQACVGKLKSIEKHWKPFLFMNVFIRNNYIQNWVNHNVHEAS